MDRSRGAWRAWVGAARGWWVQVVGNGIYFASNVWINAALRERSNFGMPAVVAEALAGGLTGIVFKLCIYPLDTIKALRVAMCDLLLGC